MAKAMTILIYFAPILGNFSMSNHWWHVAGHIPYASARLIYADNSSEFSINLHSAVKSGGNMQKIILTRKVVLWCFFIETKISVYRM